jgi:hypothetical protein
MVFLWEPYSFFLVLCNGTFMELENRPCTKQAELDSHSCSRSCRKAPRPWE